MIFNKFDIGDNVKWYLKKKTDDLGYIEYRENGPLYGRIDKILKIKEIKGLEYLFIDGITKDDIIYSITEENFKIKFLIKEGDLELG